MIIPVESSCLMVLCLRRICLDLPLYMVLCALPIADWLSQCIRIAGTGFDHSGISFKRWRNHSASSAHLSKAINSDSIVDLAMIVCLEDFQDTAAPPNVNTNPLVDFVSFISDIQFASL